MPYYPGGVDEQGEDIHYKPETQGEKLVMDYTRLTLWEVQDLPIDIYLYLMREAYIYGLMQTEKGREYLQNCWRMEQTKPDRKKIREKFKQRG